MWNALKVDKYPLVIERYKIMMEAWPKYDGYANVLQIAHINADYLDKRTIYIDEDELIVGNPASVPMGMEIGVRGKCYSREELDKLCEGIYTMSEADKEEVRKYDSFWSGAMRGRNEWQGSFYDDERLWPFIRSGILCPPWKSKEYGRGGGSAGASWCIGVGMEFFVPDYGKIVTEGIKKTLDDAREELRNIRYAGPDAADAFDKAQFLQAIDVALSSLVRHYHRYGDACYSKAEETADPEGSAVCLGSHPVRHSSAARKTGHLVIFSVKM